jgi:uncharacterized protein YndB with AHSA1/START domain
LSKQKVTYMQTEIKHRWFYHCGPELIWDFLTKPELLSQWLMSNDIKPVIGHQFMFKTKALPAMEFDGNVYCEILEVIPNWKLSYTWKGGPGDGSINLDSIVTWTLEAKDGGTELNLVHSGFGVKTNAKIFDAMNGGWKKNMAETLVDLITKRLTHEATDR